jgi:tetratricopeptide (TPR) repeat protein
VSELQGGSRDALIVATGNYEDPELRRLRSPAQDAAALAEALSDPEIGSFRVRQIVDQPARVVARGMQEFFTNRSLKDLLLLHVSCHGVKDDDGRLYFAAADTEREWLAATGVPAAYLADLMERCRARSIVLLLDCCYSGAFLPGSKGDRGLDLRERLEGEGRAILTASNALEYAWEGEDLRGQGQPSLFTAAIVEGLQTGKADRDRDGAVSITDLYQHVYERVREAKRGQTPQLWTLKVQNNVYVARNPHLSTEASTVVLPPEIQAALEQPLASVRAGVVEDLVRLLQGSNPGLASAARRSLEQLREDDSRRVAVAAAAAINDHPPRKDHYTQAARVPKVKQERIDHSATGSAQPAAEVVPDGGEPDASESQRPEEAARALLQKSTTLRQLGRSEQAIAAYDEVVERFGRFPALQFREQVARALLNKGIVLGQLDRAQQEIAAYDQLVERYGQASELELREQVARALLNKGVALGQLGRREQEIAVYDELVERFGEAPELELRKQVARALFNKGTFGHMGRRDQEIAAYDELVARFGKSPELELREQVGRALLSKGVALRQLDRPEDAIAVYDELVARFRLAQEPELSRLVHVAREKLRVWKPSDIGDR